MSARILKGKHLKPTLDKISLGEFFFQHGTKYADKICQINGDIDQSEKYGSVKTRSVRLAINLQKKGISTKDVICTCSFNSLDVTIPIISTLFLGATIANLDPTLSSRNTIYLLNLVNPKIIFVDEESLELIEKCVNEAKLKCEIVTFGSFLKYTSFESLVKPCPNEESFRPTKVDVHDDAVLFFSSGTTGMPKAICHSHKSFLQVTETSQHHSLNNSVVLYFTTYYWISGMLMLTKTFLDGGTRVFARNMEGQSTFQIIEKYKVTTMFMAPLFTYQLTNFSNIKNYDISSFRYLLTGGTSLSNDQQIKLQQMFPNTFVFLGYGLSEFGIATLFSFEDDKEFINTKIGSSGKVCCRTLLKVVDTITNKILPPNQKGEIRLKSDSVMKGYYKMDTSDCFDEDGFLKTGDIGYYDEDECIYIVERIKEMFKYRSWHIVPSIIEAVLLEHPAVEEAVVFGVPRGEDGEVPTACVVLKKNSDANKQEIEKFVEDRVSDKEKLRGGVIFVNSLPKTPSGKCIRNEAKNFAIKSM